MSKNKKTPKWITILIIALAVFTLICICAGIGVTNYIANLSTPTPIPSATFTQIAQTPSYDEIRNASRSLTTAQWNDYRSTLIGASINWDILIDDVTGVGENLFIYAHINPGGLINFPLPRDQAIKLNIGQRVAVHGQIGSIIITDDGLQISLENVTLPNP